jgi:ABC-2 type transport system ATP-binding protein
MSTSSCDCVVEARGLHKRFGSVHALRGIDLEIPSGKIVGLIGRNGAGKTTALKAILGLTSFEGSLQVLGRHPFAERYRLMEDVSYIADVAVLPKWMTAGHVLDFAEACHPRFARAAAEMALESTDIRSSSKIRTLSKGMIVQLHLALVMAIDARLLVLDEPTLGLDIVYRKMFYSKLLNDYFDHSRTILITTHQVEEIEHIVTDVVFIEHGEIVLDETVDGIARRYVELAVDAAKLEAARRLGPISERRDLGQTLLMYEDRSRAELEGLGELHQPQLADLFVAKVTGGVA